MSNNDVNKLTDFLNDTTNKGLKSNITYFTAFGNSYRWTNEKFELYPKVNLENKKILTITSSGDHALEAILNGAKNINSIDINEFSKYVSTLKIAMIKKYGYEDFFEKFDDFTDLYHKDVLILMKTLDEISVFLSPLEIEFWNTYIKYINRRIKEETFYINELFYYDSKCEKRKNTYYSKDNYTALKYALDDVKITYYDGDIINVNGILEGNMYDVVYLSNILQRIPRCDIKYRAKLIKNILKVMNKEGIIYNYLFSYLDSDIEKIFDNYYDNNSYFDAIKDNINTNFFCDTSMNAVLAIRKK